MGGDRVYSFQTFVFNCVYKSCCRKTIPNKDGCLLSSSIFGVLSKGLPLPGLEVLNGVMYVVRLPRQYNYRKNHRSKKSRPVPSFLR